MPIGCLYEPLPGHTPSLPVVLLPNFTSQSIPPGTPGVSTNNYGVGAIASWQAAADRRLYGIELTYRFTAARR